MPAIFPCLCRLFAALALATALVLSVPASADAGEVTCEIDRPVVFAGLDWQSNAFHTAVVRYVIENGYGCRTDVIPGTTLPLLAGMRRGDIDVTMEIWPENITEAWAEGVAAGELKEVGTTFPDARQGWFVPRYLIEGDGERGIEARAPDLKSVFDLPRYAELFRDPEEPDKGRFYNCILGWACETVNTRKLRLYGLDAHYTNFRPGSPAALSAAIASNYRRGHPFLAYYWSPTWVLGRFDLVQLDEPPYEREAFETLALTDNPEQAVAYPVSRVVVGAHRDFVAAAPRLVAFLAAYETTNAEVSEVLSWLEENRRARPEDAAVRFLKADADRWRAWVPAEVAARLAPLLDDPGEAQP